MPELDLSAPVFPGHAEKRERQAAALETVLDRIIQVVEADGPDIAGLLLVRDAVLSCTPERFDLEKWKCGSTCCAIGWFCTFNPDDRLQLHGVANGTGTAYYPRLADNSRGFSWYDIAARFRLTAEQAVHLFSPKDDYHTRSQFLSRLESFIAAHSSPPFTGLTADAFAAGNLLLERDELDHAENQRRAEWDKVNTAEEFDGLE